MRDRTTIPIHRIVTLIGRRAKLGNSVSPDIDLADVDEDQTVSRQHAKIVWQEGGLVIEDLGSLNGTEVDGRRIARGQWVALPDGTSIVFGTIEFVLDMDATWPEGLEPEWDRPPFPEELHEPPTTAESDPTVVLRPDLLPHVQAEERRHRWWSPSRWVRRRTRAR